MSSIVVIFCLEGDESRTEQNFFNGINFHTFPNPEIVCVGLIKSKRTSASERVRRKVLEEFVPVMNKNQTINIFYIGDGDSMDDINAMKNSCKIASETINKHKKQQKINEKILILNNKKFEDVLKFTFPKKSKKYKTGFNDFAKHHKLESKDEKDLKAKLLCFFQDTEYNEIFELISKL